MKNKAIGSSFDDFLLEEGIADEVEAGAIKKIIAYQLQEAIALENAPFNIGKKQEISWSCMQYFPGTEEEI